MGKHAEWRKLAKKLRRKRIRSALAAARDYQLLQEQEKRERSPTYRAWLEEQAVLEEFNAAEENRLAMERQQLWEANEEQALLRWREQQSRLAQAKAEKFKKEILIKEEWEREQRKLQEAEELKKKSEDERKRKQAKLLEQIDAFIEGNADLPEEVNVSTQTQPGHPDCPFFSKTGACRFRDSCSRNHTRPGVSRTLLIPNFYDHFGLQTLHHDEYDTDVGLEYEESETYQHFMEFYKDVFSEFEQFGKIFMFKVCNNEEPHLRGNVYVEFHSRRNALKAYRTFQGRFYAGRRLNVEFTSIPSWKNAICGLFHRQKCPKGKTCNFLHVFRNPNNAFKVQDGHSSSRRQFSRSRSRSPQRRRSRSKEWNWSDASGSDNESRRKRSRSRSLLRNRVRSKKNRTGSDDSKRSRSRSPSRAKVNSRNRDSSRDRRRRKEKRREEKYRSPSSSPRRDKKRNTDDNQDESNKKIKNFKNYEASREKETNGREQAYKTSKTKENGKKKNNNDKYEKDDYPRKKKRDDSIERESYGREESSKPNKSKRDDRKENNTEFSSKKKSDRRHEDEYNMKRSKKKLASETQSTSKMVEGSDM